MASKPRSSGLAKGVMRLIVLKVLDASDLSGPELQHPVDR